MMLEVTVLPGYSPCYPLDPGSARLGPMTLGKTEQECALKGQGQQLRRIYFTFFF